MLMALIGAGNIVENVAIPPDGMDEIEAILWFTEHVGGVWVVTWEGHSTERRAGVGMVYAPGDDRKFLFEGES